MAKKKLFSELPYLECERLVLRKLEDSDAEALRELTGNPRVYRYEPTFLFERRYEDPHEVIRRLYVEGIKESMILGIFMGGEFCGLAEFYGYRDEIRKVSVGYRLAERFWGMGIATEALGRMIRYLLEETDIEIITASTQIANKASAHILEKNGFVLVVTGADEDWGYDQPLPTDKWIL